MRHLFIRDALTLTATLVALTTLALKCGAAEPPPALSISLADAQKLVTKSSLPVAEAREDAAIADAGLRSAMAESKPSASATTYASIGDTGNILTSSPAISPQNIFSVPSRAFADQNITLMAPIYTGGKLSGQIEAARLQSIAASDGISAAQLTAQSDVTQAYAQALLAQQLAIVAKSRLAAEDEQVRVTQDKVDAGHLAPVDLLREQSELADAAQAKLAADNNSAIALVDLKTVLGLDLATEITLTDTLDEALQQPAKLPPDLTAAVSEAMRSRPEFKAADSEIGAADANVQAAKGAYSPQIYGVGMADAPLAEGGQPSGFTVGVAVSVPLYDDGERRAEVDVVRARSARIRTDALKLRQSIARQVTTAWLNFQTASAQVEAAKSGEVVAAEGFRLADLRYNAGKSTTAERLDALAANTKADGALAQAEADAITARGMLLASIGQDSSTSNPASH